MQGSTGLTGGQPIATANQTGGVSSDAFNYTLSGANAGAFTLSTSGTLGIGSSGVAGSANGMLYAITITAHDTSNGTSSPAVPVQLVVGSGSPTTGDAINLSTMSGMTASSPTFIYGLAGNDTISGAGISGPLFFDGGAGADTMTGGSGVNTYMFAAVSDSTPLSTDVVTNFHMADVLDFRGLGTALVYDGNIPAGHGADKKSAAPTLPAHSIGWQQSAGNTYVYVNTSGSSESLTSPNMKVELLGSVSLASGNILHG